MKTLKKTLTHTIMLPIYSGLVCVLIVAAPIYLSWWAVDEVAG